MFKEFLPSLRKQSFAPNRPTSIADLMGNFWREPFGPFQALEFFKEPAFPAVDISETDTVVQVKAEMPGLEPSDVKITLQNDILTIQGEKKFENEEKKEYYHRIERSYGSFLRSVPLPSNVDEEKVKAQFDKGILTIVMAKKENASAKTIPIES